MRLTFDDGFLTAWVGEFPLYRWKADSFIAEHGAPIWAQIALASSTLRMAKFRPRR